MREAHLLKAAPFAPSESGPTSGSRRANSHRKSLYGPKHDERNKSKIPRGPRKSFYKKQMKQIKLVWKINQKKNQDPQGEKETTGNTEEAQRKGLEKRLENYVLAQAVAADGCLH